MPKAESETSTRLDRRSAFKTLGAAVAAVVAGIGKARSAPTDTAADPILDLVAEHRRLLERAAHFEEQGDERYFALPDDLRRLPRIMLSVIRPNGAKHQTPFEFLTRDELEEWLNDKRLTEEQRARYIAEWEADKEALDAAKASTGCLPFYRQAEAIEAEAYRLYDRIQALPARTVPGVIVQVETLLVDPDEAVQTVLAGLRDIAARAAA
jgi:hypothetical protein